jgi:OmpA-OmpF porin, OOP family
MLRAFGICLITTFLAIPAVAQREGVYYFQNNFEEISGSLPALKILGKQGGFAEEPLPQLNNTRQTVYNFEKNCGLQFDNRAAGGFIGKTYTIEVYFRFTMLDSWKRVIDFKSRRSDNGCYIYDGKLNFYNFALGTKAPVRPNKYTHLVVSRDGNTGLLKMYVDGDSRIEFIDRFNQGLISEEGVLNFFFDDLIVKDEASAGAVSMIKLYDYVKSPEAVKRDFLALEKIVTTKAPAVVALPKVATPAPKPPVESRPAPPPPASKIFYGQVENAKNKQLINTAIMVVLDSNMVEIQRLKTQNGQFSFEPKPNTEYNFIVEAVGYLPLGLHFSPKDMKETLTFNNIFPIEPIAVGQNFVLREIRFVQSKAELLGDSELELKRIALFMKENPTVEIELQGHTDNQGDFELNLALSKQRVETVKAILVKQGIEAKRVTGRGFGSTRPIASNNREETRQLNRRVELVIKKY